MCPWPFGAAVFEARSGRVVSLGVSLPGRRMMAVSRRSVCFVHHPLIETPQLLNGDLVRDFL